MYKIIQQSLATDEEEKQSLLEKAHEKATEQQRYRPPAPHAPVLK